MKVATTYVTQKEFDELTNNMKECKHFKNVYVSRDGKKIVEVYPDRKIWYDNTLVAYIEKTVKEGVCLNNAGYYLVATRHGVKLVHRLVADAWMDEDIINKEIDHIDGNKYNNSIDNLRIVTHSENMKAAWKNGQVRKPSKHCRYSRATNTLFFTNGTQQKMSEREYCIWRAQHGLRLVNWMKEYAK